MTVDEPAVDLGMAAAVASSLRNRPVDESAVAIGEIGLAGELRAVPQVEKRLQEAARLGFRLAVVPRQGAPEHTPGGIEIVETDSVADAMARLVT
jgi:DNA repair protein RadA/Sms